MKKESLQRKNVIILVKEDGSLECWGSLKLACRSHPQLVYNTITKMKLPLFTKGLQIHRVSFNKKSDDKR